MTAEIYAARNLVNGKVYVGSARMAVIRERQHKCGLNGNRSHNPHLQYAWNKYGAHCFEWAIIEVCAYDDRVAREQWWIDALRASDPRYGYNVMHLVRGVTPSPRRSLLSREMWADPIFKAITRAKIKAAWNTPEHLAHLAVRMKTFWRNAEYAEAQSKRMKAHWQDPEYREKVSRRRQEMWQDPEYIAKIKEHRQRTGASPEYQAGQSRDSKARWADPEFKEKMRVKARAAWADPEIRARRLAAQERGRVAARARKLARNEIV